jgi:hypothetical protein
VDVRIPRQGEHDGFPFPVENEEDEYKDAKRDYLRAYLHGVESKAEASHERHGCEEKLAGRASTSRILTEARERSLKLCTAELR